MNNNYIIYFQKYLTFMNIIQFNIILILEKYCLLVITYYNDCKIINKVKYNIKCKIAFPLSILI